jgi:hypothetical protein
VICTIEVCKTTQKPAEKKRPVRDGHSFPETDKNIARKDEKSEQIKKNIMGIKFHFHARTADFLYFTCYMSTFYIRAHNCCLLWFDTVSCPKQTTSLLVSLHTHPSACNRYSDSRAEKRSTTTNIMQTERNLLH